MMRKERGFSLVEIVIVTGLMAGVSLVMLKIFSTQQTAKNSIVSDYEMTEILHEMRTVLSTTQNCTNTFQGKSPNSGMADTMYRIVDGTSEETMKTTSSDPSSMWPGGIKVISYQLDNTLGNLDSDETYLKVTFETGSDTLRKEKTKMIKLRYSVDGSGNVDECYSIGGNRNTFWTQSDLNRDNIHYTTGNVGVGVDNPTAKLDVAGIVKVGDDPSVNCNAANAGMMKYDSSMNQMVYCNGLDWSSITSGFTTTGPGIGDSISANNGSRAFSFPNIPSGAKAVTIAYKIGHPGDSGPRRDVYCTINPGNIYFGHDSRGDGLAKMSAGTATIPLRAGQVINCRNDFNTGFIRVIGIYL